MPRNEAAGRVKARRFARPDTERRTFPFCGRFGEDTGGGKVSDAGVGLSPMCTVDDGRAKEEVESQPWPLSAYKEPVNKARSGASPSPCSALLRANSDISNGQRGLSGSK